MGEVIKNLPDDKRHWHYGYNTMKSANIYLDEMTKHYIDTYKKDDFNLLLSKLDRQEEVLKEAYGVGKREKYKDYRQNKIDDLYKRIGNSFLSDRCFYHFRFSFGNRRIYMADYSRTCITGYGYFQYHFSTGNKVCRAYFDIYFGCYGTVDSRRDRCFCI